MIKKNLVKMTCAREMFGILCDPSLPCDEALE